MSESPAVTGGIFSLNFPISTCSIPNLNPTEKHCSLTQRSIHVSIPAIVIAELYYLNGKKGRPLDFRTKYARLAQSKQFVLLPFHPSHTLDFDACSTVTEIHDRMIAVDARRNKATLLTRDTQIASSGVVATVWWVLNRSACLTCGHLADTRLQSAAKEGAAHLRFLGHVTPDHWGYDVYVIDSA